MSNNQINDTIEYLTRLYLENQNLLDETPQSLTILYKETYDQISKEFQQNDESSNKQRISY